MDKLTEDLATPNDGERGLAEHMGWSSETQASAFK
jgi:hypothetical protein